MQQFSQEKSEKDEFLEYTLCDIKSKRYNKKPINPKATLEKSTFLSIIHFLRS